MSNLGWYQRIHGQQQHTNITMHAAKMIVIRGGRIKDPSVFKKCNPPCEPDLYFDYDDHGKKFQGVLEVETNATKESIARKQRQYEEQVRGVILHVLDCKKGFDRHGGEVFDSIRVMERWLDEELPI